MYEIAKTFDIHINRLYHPMSNISDNWSKKHQIEKQYHQDKANLMKQFEEALFKKYNLTEHPHKHKIYDLAYEHGHSEGLQKIEEWVDTLTSILD